MAWCEPEVVCRKHPNHKQQPGVCSCCLRERLSKLSVNNTLAAMAAVNNNNDNNNNNSSVRSNVHSSPANYYSSASSSTHMSPRHHRGSHHRIASDVLISLSTISGIGKSSSGLKKSRSIAFAAADGRGRDGVKGKKKQGFWAKFLMKSTGNKRTK